MTEPVPGIRPTPNQMEGRAARGEKGEGTIGMTQQAGGAGCFSDKDIETCSFQMRVKVQTVAGIESKIKGLGASGNCFVKFLYKRLWKINVANCVELDLWETCQHFSHHLSINA